MVMNPMVRSQSGKKNKSKLWTICVRAARVDQLLILGSLIIAPLIGNPYISL